MDIPVGSFSSTDYAHAALLIDAGYKAAEQSRAALLRCALDADGWKAYLDARESRRSPQPGLLRQVRVEGGEPGAVRQVLDDMNPIEGQPISPASTLDALKRIQFNDGIAATWETFVPQGTPASSSAPTAGAPTPDTGILVRLSNDSTGPPYLLISPELAAATSNISRGEMTFRLVDQNFGGFGSEFRGDARIGYEAGEVWSPETRSILRQDGTAGLVANTPLGLVTFGISAGDAGHRKVFVTLGRWFW